MKRLLTILFLSFIVNYSFAQVKVNSEGDIIPTGIYPAVKSSNIKGTVHFFQTLTQRDALPNNFRDTGMIAYVQQSSKFYYLDNGTQNSNWKELILTGNNDEVISGGIITWISGLTFNFSASVFRKFGVIYHTNDTTITLDPADANYNRIDIFALDTTNGGEALKITGVPSPIPIAPQPLDYQIARTSGFNINVGDTIPANVSIQKIYDENIEWATGTDRATVDFNNTTFPYTGNKDAFVSSYANIGRLVFTRSGTGVIDGSEVLRFRIALTSPLRTKKLQIGFFHGAGTTLSSNIIGISSNNGLDPNKINQYQTITIPVSYFQWSDYSYNRIILYISDYDTSFVVPFYLDDMELQTGVNNIPQQVDYSSKVDSTTIKKINDSTYIGLYWIKGISYQKGDTVKIHSIATVGDIDVLQNTIDSSSFGIKKLDGIVKNVVIYADGLTSVGGGGSYTLPIASSSILGGIKIGSGLAINGSGVLSAYTNNNQLTNGANYTTIPIADTRYQPLENQRLSKNNNVYFNKITTVPSGGDSVEIYGGVVIAHNSFGGYAALNHDSNGGIVTIENKNGFDGLISGKNITSPQLYFLPNTSNGIAGNTLPISVNGNFADVSGNITISTGGTYTLPTASATVLGGVKVGSGLAIDGSGVLSATGGGTPSLEQVVQVGNTSSIDIKVNGLTVGKGTGSMSNNTALGVNALYFNSGGDYSTAVGSGVLMYNKGSDNTGVGVTALQFNTTGYLNTGIGSSSLYKNTTGISNTAIGSYSLQYNTTGSFNTANGNAALNNNLTGNLNVAIGASALVSNVQGSNNTSFGSSSSAYIETDRNTAIGYNSNSNFKENSTASKTFGSTNISGNNITITSHGFGTNGQKILLLYREGSGSIGGLSPNVIYSATIIDANTISISGIGSSSGVTGASLTPQYNWTNMTAVGSNAINTAANQVVLGDSLVTQVLTYGNVLSKVAVKSTDPTTTDIPTGFTAIYRNSTSGLTYLWANISGTLIKVQLQ